MAPECVRSSLFTLACSFILAGTVGAQHEKRIESTVKRLEAKLDQVETYLQSLQSGSVVQKEKPTLVEARAEAERIAQLEDQLADSRSALEVAGQRSAQIEAVSGALANELTAALEDQRKVTAAVTAAEERERGRAEALQVKCDELENSLHSASAEISSLTARHAELQQGVAAAGDLHRRITAREQGLRQRMEHLSAQAEKHAVAASEQQTAMQRMRDAVDTVRSRNAELTDRLAEAEQHLEAAQTEKAQLQAALEQTQNAARQQPTEAESVGHLVEGGIHVHDNHGTVILQLGGGEVELTGAHEQAASSPNTPPAPDLGALRRRLEAPRSAPPPAAPLHQRSAAEKKRPPQSTTSASQRKINL